VPGLRAVKLRQEVVGPLENFRADTG
jgi:hypothetical protein